MKLLLGFFICILKVYFDDKKKIKYRFIIKRIFDVLIYIYKKIKKCLNNLIMLF